MKVNSASVERMCLAPAARMPLFGSGLVAIGSSWMTGASQLFLCTCNHPTGPQMATEESAGGELFQEPDAPESSSYIYLGRNPGGRLFAG